MSIGITGFFGFNKIEEGLDPDVQAFLTATGITDGTIIDGLNEFVVDMKSNNLWSKMTVIYPFVGGTAFTHKFNLKNPADTNAAYRLSFSGTFSHSTTGVLPNGGQVGENTEALTHLNVTQFSQNDVHISVYSRTNGGLNINSAGPVEIGASSSNARFYMATNYGGNSGLYYISNLNNSGANNVNYGGSQGAGFYLSTRTSSANYRVFRNGVIGATHSKTSLTPLSDDIYLFKNRNVERSNKELCFSSLGNGLTNDEVVTFSNLVNTLQTTLGRNVY